MVFPRPKTKHYSNNAVYTIPRYSPFDTDVHEETGASSRRRGQGTYMRRRGTYTYMRKGGQTIFMESTIALELQLSIWLSAVLLFCLPPSSHVQHGSVSNIEGDLGHTLAFGLWMYKQLQKNELRSRVSLAGLIRVELVSKYLCLSMW